MFRSVYYYTIMIINCDEFIINGFLKKYFSFPYAEELFDVKFSELDLISRVRFALFPDIHHIDYNFVNEDILKLATFRTIYLDFFVETYNKFSLFTYNVLGSSSKSLKKVCDLFEKKNESSNILVLNDVSFGGFIVYVYAWFFFFTNHFSTIFSTLFFTCFDEKNLTKIYFIFYQLIFQKKISFDIFEKFPENEFNNQVSIDFMDLNKFSIWFLFLKKKVNLFVENSNQFEVCEDMKESLVTPSLFDVLVKKKRTYLEIFQKICFSLFTREFISKIKVYRKLNFNLGSLHNMLTSGLFLKKMNDQFPVKFEETSTNKFISLSKLDKYVFLFLRKSKIFNKGRYSRNRQTYRTGFYWCLWLNIFVVYGLHFVFYRTTLTFGYLWAFLFIFFSLFLISRAIKYKLYSVSSFLEDVTDFINLFANWWGVIRDGLVRLWCSIKKKFNTDFIKIKQSDWYFVTVGKFFKILDEMFVIILEKYRFELFSVWDMYEIRLWLCSILKDDKDYKTHLKYHYMFYIPHYNFFNEPELEESVLWDSADEYGVDGDFEIVFRNDINKSEKIMIDQYLHNYHLWRIKLYSVMIMRSDFDKKNKK